MGGTGSYKVEMSDLGDRFNTGIEGQDGVKDKG
jgi:hypothetical protein